MTALCKRPIKRRASDAKENGLNPSMVFSPYPHDVWQKNKRRTGRQSHCALPAFAHTAL